jgi:hypothetical protein
MIEGIVDSFSKWIGMGWGLTFLVWLAGGVVILTVGYRYFLQRFHSRLPTAVAFVVWTLTVLGIAGSYLGYAAPAGR